MNCLLTVVTVVRNDPDGLKTTEDSLAGQLDLGESRLEWLIVDGSDGEMRVVDRALAIEWDIATRVVYEEPHGIYAAMNKGLQEASGEFVLYLNAGDTFASPTALAQILGTLRRSGSVTWVVGRIRVVDRRGRVVDSALWNFDEEKSRLFARGAFPPHQATIVRTEVLRGLGGFASDYAVAADYHAAMRLSLASEPVMMDEVLAEFHEGGTSTIQWKRASREFHRARVEVFRPSGRQRLEELGHTWINRVEQLIVRDVLRRDK